MLGRRIAGKTPIAITEKEVRDNTASKTEITAFRRQASEHGDKVRAKTGLQPDFRDLEYAISI